MVGTIFFSYIHFVLRTDFHLCAPAVCRTANCTAEVELCACRAVLGVSLRHWIKPLNNAEAFKKNYNNAKWCNKTQNDKPDIKHPAANIVYFFARSGITHFPANEYSN